jgi:arylsulfatase A
MTIPLRALTSLLLLIGIVLHPRPVAAAPGGTTPPNIILILADDLGWTDLACYGSDLHETPNLDRLARQGVRFTQAYAMPICSPTRAAILAGKHAARLNFTIWREGSLRREADVAKSKRKLLPPVTAFDLAQGEITIAEALKARGYQNFHVGKWHLGDADHSPETQGFDINIGGTHWGAPNTFFWPFTGAETFPEFRYVPGLGLGKPGEYLTDRLTDEALKLMDAAGERPFFLNLWFYNPHTPIEGKPEVTERFRQKIKPGLRHANPDYAAMIFTLDENVGRILAHLDQRGLADRTLVVFVSDNGGFINNFRGTKVTDNTPLRSGKGSLYEGGIRVPFIARLPGVTPPNAVCNEPVICMDLFRTFTELAGADGASGSDSLSLMPLLKNPKARLQRDALFFHYPHYYPTTSPVSAVRLGDWKLLEYHEDNRLELFDLKEDLGESIDLAARRPEKASELRERLHAWRTSVKAGMPTPNPRAPAAR